MKKNLCFLILFLIGILKAFAGGFEIISSSVTLNGYGCGAIFAPGEKIEMRYIARDYSFSGGNYEYFLFRLFKPIKISGSVGFQGANKPEDVKQIQTILKGQGFYAGNVNGLSSNELVTAIKDFQKRSALRRDGRVDVNGSTLFYMTPSKPIYFLQLAKDHLKREGYDFSFSLIITLPRITTDYIIAYHRFPIFSNTALGIKAGKFEMEMNDAALAVAEQHAQQYPGKFEEICALTVSTGSTPTSPELYLKLNDQVPAQKSFDLGTKPVKFSWYAERLTPSMDPLYRYRLYPDEDWSGWQPTNEVRYYFINKGQHEFQVECRYEKSGEQRVTNQARVSFPIEKPFIAAPTNRTEFDKSSDSTIIFIDKGDVVRSTKNAKEVTSRVYDNSTALIFGVDTYDDHVSWVPLPFIRNDLDMTKAAFEGVGFTVKRPNAKTRAQITSEIRKAIINSSRNDRLIIYISSHGFIDPASNQPLIVSKDCSKTDPVNCVRLSELKELMKGAENKIRHVLLILDCCTSGIGVVDKSTALGGLRSLATSPGEHILTAGMADQNAKMSNEFQMSVFTKFLAEGLMNKSADYTGDGIITLTELLIYVQYNVSKLTNSEQVPMWGRISGFGEMIFVVK